MTNEYGAPLDRNGYAPSIVPNHEQYRCFLCGRNGGGKMDRHEALFGPHRDKSKRLGLWVHLCHDPCHLYGAHRNREMDMEIKRAAQWAAMETYGWDTEKFIEEFGRNYLAE